MERAFEERDKVQLGLARHGLQILTHAEALQILWFAGPNQSGEGALEAGCCAKTGLPNRCMSNSTA
jgi:hypothetical protein